MIDKEAVDSLEQLTVFICDDTLPNIDVLSQILEEEGYRVSFAESGEEALEMIPELLPDLILMDVMMPGIDGYETCKRLKAMEEIKDIPLIFVTAKNDIEDVLHALHVGGVDYITKPVQREEVLARVKAHIQTRQLMKQIAEMDKEVSLARVVAGVAHEINTPIGNGISAASELQTQTEQVIAHLKENQLGKNELAKYLDTAHRATRIICSNLDRAGHLIKSFKSVSTSQMDEQKTHFNLKAHLADVLMTIEPSVKKTKHKIEVECPDDIELDSYPGGLSQVIINLVMNGIIHAFDEQDEGLFQIKVEDRDQEVLIRFIDNGKGMPQEVVDKIFDPFFTTKRGQGGTGLGLHIVHTTVNQLLAGRIICKSKEGEGTIFSITLPKRIEDE